MRDPLPPEAIPGSKERVVLGLGSNLGDRLGHLRDGVKRLSQVIGIEETSPVYESAPAKVPPQPDFLNAVLSGWTDLSPEGLLRLLREVEEMSGRPHPHPDGEPRTLDVDILFLGDRILRTADLVIPHPLWKERAFVVIPLRDLDPELRDPESGRTVEEVWRSGASSFGALRKVADSEALSGS